jgi:MFS transporter, DHA2 family, methylenomycin A resistance protein
VAGFIEAGQRGRLGGLPQALIAGGLAAAVVFVLVERRAALPMLPLGLFRSRAYSASVGVGVGLLFNLCAYGALLCLSLYLQRTRGYSPLETGLLGTSLVVVLAGSLALGLCSLAMPAMTAVALGAADPVQAGPASGVLNAARQAGGALGVAALGALLLASGSGDELDLHSALPLACAGYLVAMALTLVATRGVRP